MKKDCRYFKPWDDLQREFDVMQDMSCVPYGIRRVSQNFIFDENESVKWNKQQAVLNNEAYQKEVARLNTVRNKRRDEILEDIYFNIQYEVGHNLPREKAVSIWNVAWKMGHSFGIYSVRHHLEDLIDLVRAVLKE